MIKRSLQVYLAFVAFILFEYGLVLLIFGQGAGIGDLQLAEIQPAVDNQIRYSGGMFIGLATITAWLILDIEKKITLMRIYCFMNTLAGLGRLASLLLVGPGLFAQTWAMAFELSAPLLLLWQYYARLEKNKSLPGNG